MKKTRETEAAKTKIQNYIVDEKCNMSSEYMEQFTEDEVNNILFPFYSFHSINFCVKVNILKEMLILLMLK